MAKSPAKRRYQRRVILFSLAYVLALFGVRAFFDNATRTGISAYAAAILPALPIVGIFVALGQYMAGESDEYQRMLLVRQSLVATAFTLTVATIWGFLESFELVPHVPAYAAAILWFGGLGLGGCLNRFGLDRQAS